VRKANVVACGTVECLVLERSAFQSLLTEVQDDLVNEMSKRENTTAASDARRASLKPEDTSYLEPRTAYAYTDLKIMRTVGTGTFGRVKMVQHVGSGSVCALKCMNKSEVVASHQERNIMAEKNLLFECSTSPFVLQLLQTYR
jgi:serine/threonine protein kinase